MSQSWHPEDSDWREGSEHDNSVVVPCIVIDRPFIVPVISPQPHVVLCSAYDDDEDDEE